MANTFRKVYKKTGNNGNDSDYELIANVGVNGIDLDLMKGATTELDGEIGLVPKPSAGTINRYLRCDGTWAVPPDTNTTYNLSSFGITATAAEINKLDGLTASKTELNYTDGLTSNIQTQINSIKNKLGNIKEIGFKSKSVNTGGSGTINAIAYISELISNPNASNGNTWVYAFNAHQEANPTYIITTSLRANGQILIYTNESFSQDMRVNIIAFYFG